MEYVFVAALIAVAVLATVLAIQEVKEQERNQTNAAAPTHAATVTND